MTVSMRVMSAGTGYRYLLQSVAVGDGNRDLSSPLVDYYAAEGTPPGRWLGSGVAGLGDGWVAAGDVVTEDQLRLLLGTGRDPVTGAALGRAFPVFRPLAERIQTRVDKLHPVLPDADRAAAIQRIGVEEGDRKARRAVAGFDFTFSAPKSVSVLWALAGPDTREQIEAAHRGAIGDVIGLMEREVAATRMGSAGPDGLVAQVEVQGLIATAFEHYDSRAGDPQLHTHVVIANKVKTVVDGKWRSLDGRPLHAAVVAMSEHYNAVLADRLAADLGVNWQQRSRGADRNTGWEIAGVPEELLEVFSSRSLSINTVKDTLIKEYRERHGHLPAARTIIRLRQQATLATRPDKTVQSLENLIRNWRSTAIRVLDDVAPAWLQELSARPAASLSLPGLSDGRVAELAAEVVRVVGEKRSTWRRWNLHAEASRQTMGLRFTNADQREQALSRIVAAAELGSIRLTPPELAPTPPELQRSDGTSQLRPRHATVYTSATLLAAEDRILTRARTVTGPVVSGDVARLVADADRDVRLGQDQLAALQAVVTSGRPVDVLIGPAGAGKTTAMRALRRVWESVHGTSAVVGLAPSAAAAQVLAADLGIPAENTAKWLHDHHSRTVRFRPGQLVIIDEASLAGTHTLDQIVEHAAAVDAKVLLVGDWAQLGAVDAGGVFKLLVDDRDDVPELTTIRRFIQSWESDATRRLRQGDPAVIDTYHDRGRIVDGDTDAMTERAYAAWQDDLAEGRSSVLIAPTHQLVKSLNHRARTDRIRAGQVDPTVSVRLHDSNRASVGDEVVTRRNNRRLATGNDWVRNGDRWRLTAISDDGSATVKRLAGPGRGATVRLPAEYMARHVQLGYAVTVHRAQGTTVDTAHAILTPGMTRETLYVAMTRGRHANHPYVATDHPDTEPHQQHVPAMGRTVLTAILGNAGAEQSAHHTLRHEQRRWSTIGQLAAEYETLAGVAQHHRWTTLILASGLTPTQAETVVASAAFGPLCAELRRADAHHLQAGQILPHLLADRQIDDADDVASVLHHRLSAELDRYEQATGPTRPTSRMIVGLIPEATGPMTTDMHAALSQRRDMIQQRATTLAQRAIVTGAPWVQSLGRPPADPDHRRVWTRCVTTVAAYRDRYQIPRDAPLSVKASSATRSDTTHARAAILRAPQPAVKHEPAAQHLASDRTYRPTRASSPPERRGPSF